MHEVHDDRRVPVDPQPESRSLLESIRHWLSIGRARRTKREDAQAKAAEKNRPYREAEARRALSQPGVSDEIVDKAARVFARIGKGEGFADLALLPAIALACVAILRAVAVLL